MALNAEQRKVLRMVVDEGKNVFFTGAAGECISLFCTLHSRTLRLPGTGKSLLLRAIILALRRKHAKKPEVVSVTASTGMAASNIGGEILHIFSSIFYSFRCHFVRGNQAIPSYCG